VHLKALHALDGDADATVERVSAQSTNARKRPRYGNEDDAQDLAWDRPRPLKKLRKTYKSRQNANQARRADEAGTQIGKATDLPLGTISVPTPFLNRTISAIQIPDQSHSQSGSLGHQIVGPPALMRTCSSKKRGETISHVVQDLMRILGQTQPQQHRLWKSRRGAPMQELSSNVGASSLFDMCIRSVPAYIANEEAWKKEEGEENIRETDVTTSTYALLEDMGHGQNAGWMHLSAVVQAHAVYAIRNVVETKGFHRVDELRSILGVLYNHNLILQGRATLRSYVLAHGKFPLPTLARASSHQPTSEVRFKPSGTTFDNRCFGEADPHATWMCILAFLGNEALLNEQIFASKVMLQEDYLPAEWLSCPAITYQWSSLLQSMSLREEARYSSEDFMHQYLRSICQIQGIETETENTKTSLQYKSSTIQEAGLRTLNGVLSTLVFLAMSESKEDVSDLSIAISAIRPVRMAVLDMRLSKRTQLKDLDGQALTAQTMVLAADMLLTLQISNWRLSDHVVDFHLATMLALHTVLTSREGYETSSYEQVAKLIYAVCDSWSRASQESSMPLFRAILGSLLACAKISQEGRPKAVQKRWIELLRFIKRVVLESALLFDSIRPSRESAAYLHSIEVLTSQSSKAEMQQPRDSDIIASSPATAGRLGFRWEQGISEWVASTPASLLQVKTMAKQRILHTPHRDVPETPNIADSVKRWSAQSKEGFVGVVIPSHNVTPSSLWRSKNGMSRPGLTHAQNIPTVVSPISFEDASVCVLGERDKENRPDCTSLDSYKGGHDVPNKQHSGRVSHVVKELLLTTFNESPSCRPKRSLRSSWPKGLTANASRLSKTSEQIEVRNEAIPPYSSSQSSGAEAAVCQRVLRPRKSARQLQLGQEDDSEDELSIHETDRCAGMSERGSGPSRANRLSLLGQAIVSKVQQRCQGGR
jgi:hypothetical protein